jgi:hypothetical protein
MSGLHVRIFDFLDRMSLPTKMRITARVEGRKGVWLQEVGDDPLLRLQSAKDVFRTPHDAATEDDVLAVAWMAMSAELRRNPQATSVEDTFDGIDTLALAAMIEGYRRRGWLHIDRALSIQPQATMAIRLTAEGLLPQDELLRRRARARLPSVASLSRTIGLLGDSEFVHPQKCGLQQKMRSHILTNQQLTIACPPKAENLFSIK